MEDAQAALDLYKLVEGEWEQELQNKLRDDDAPREPSFASSNHYMQDEYLPDDVIADSQWEESINDTTSGKYLNRSLLHGDVVIRAGSDNYMWCELK